jgi:hypothetical protein
MALRGTTSFEKGMGGWAPYNAIPAVSAGVVQDGTARAGGSFLRVRSSQFDGSVAIDVSLAYGLESEGLLQGPTGGPYPVFVQGTIFTSAVTVSAYIRAAPGGPDVQGSLVIWELLPDGNGEEQTALRFTATQNWTLISNSCEVSKRSVRVEFYLKTLNSDLDIDSIAVT